MTKYPNLLELNKYHPYGGPAICDHAGIEPELLQAVLEEGEPLLPAEIGGVARLYGVPRGLLECPRLIVLDIFRKKRHGDMVRQVQALYWQLHYMAKDGNQEAEKYLKWDVPDFKRFLYAVRHSSLSYCHYLGIKEQLSQYISFSTPKPKRRGLQGTTEAKTGGR